jgi:cupin 2 domain-containing protein
MRDGEISNRHESIWLMINVANIFSGIEIAPGEEAFHTLFERGPVTIERIVSEAHHTPADFWYDQPETEWVIVLRGEATLEFEGGNFLELKAGDHLTIPPHRKHRVDRTSPQTVWLAVHVAERE